MTLRLSRGEVVATRPWVAGGVAIALAVGAWGARPPAAHGQVAAASCSDMPSTRPIGPNESGSATVARGDLAAWVGPCGSTDRVGSSRGNYDHFFVTMQDAGDLETTIEWEDPTDQFDLFLYRGRIAPETLIQNIPKCSAESSPAGPCELGRNQETGTADLSQTPSVTFTSKSLFFKELAAGEYTVRVVYRAVLQGAYRGRVESVIPPRPPPPTNDDYSPYQWGLENIRADEAWDLATGADVTIAVIDTGIDLDHSEFHCEQKLEIIEGATVGGSGPPRDKRGHGTHVAGIAAACADGQGVTGVAPDASLMPINAVDAIEAAGAAPGRLDAALASAVRLATENGAHVINLSLGERPPVGYLAHFHPKSENAFKEARSRGVVIVAAAGNLNPAQVAGPSPLCGYPALSRYVLCVGATDRGDQVTYYSYLPNSFVEDKPGWQTGVVAPGGANRACSESVRDGIVSTDLLAAAPNCGYGTGYSEKDGTSMASPHVAGVAALVYDRLGGERSAANADAVVDTILKTTKDLYAPGWDPISGFGRVDALAAVRAIAVVEEPDPSPTPTGSDPGPGEPAPEPSPTETASAVVLPHGVTVSPGRSKDRVGADVLLTARVVDDEGRPLRGVPVEWTSVGVGELVHADAVTDSEGRAVAASRSDAPGDQQVMVWTESCTSDGRCWADAVRHHGPKRCDVFGTLGDDVLRGSDDGEVICGFGGADLIDGERGRDVLVGGAGDDHLYGNAGRDRILGGEGDDELRGGGGADVLIGGPGRDLMVGGKGGDRCRIERGDRAGRC